MSFLLSVKPKIRLLYGIIISALALIMVYIVTHYDTGFLGGLITGILLGLGLGLIVTYKKTKVN